MSTAVADIFDFWSQIEPNKNIHPSDERVFSRLGPDGHGFNHKTLPACFMGPLRTAPVVLLFMSPGLSKRDEDLAKDKETQDYYVRRRQGNEPLPDAGLPGSTWWTERTKCFETDQIDAARIRSNLAVLNISAYHSKEMKDPQLLAALPSSRVCLDWAQNILFPAAEAGERVVVCLRAVKFWGLSSMVKYDGTLYAPPVTRGGHMVQGPTRNEVIKAVRAALCRK
jgi:hypothetical protein